MIIVYFLIGFIVGFSPSLFRFIKSRQIKNNSPKGRIGLIFHKKSLNMNYDLTYKYAQDDSGRTIDVQYEVKEISTLNDLSKIKVNSICIASSRTQHNTKKFKENLINKIDNTWVKSSTIKWIVNTPAQIRDSKIDKILN